MGKVIVTQIGASLFVLVPCLLFLSFDTKGELNNNHFLAPVTYSATATIISLIWISGLFGNGDLPGIKYRWVFGAFLLQLVLLYTIVDGLMFGLMNWGLIASTAITATVIIHRAIVRYRLVKGNGLPKAVARCRPDVS